MIGFARLLPIALFLAALSTCAKHSIPNADSSYVDEHGTAHLTRVVPVPRTISPQAQEWLARPMSDADMNVSVAQDRADGEKEQESFAREMQSMYPTKLTRDTMAGVPVRIITPPNTPAEKRDLVLLNVHGGGFQADWGSVAETIPIASLTKTRVVAVLYRLAPDYPFPAAVDDTIAVYKELLKNYKPQNIVLFGTSAGAVLTGEVAVKLKSLGLPLPAALGIFSGGGDLGTYGDSQALFGFEGVKGPLSVPANPLPPDPYVGSTDVRDPLLSPLYADLKGLPPTFFLTSGRDLLLSDTVNLHRAFLHAGVEAHLVVFDALPHAFWNTYKLPESIEAHHMMADFFDRHLGKKASRQ